MSEQHGNGMDHTELAALREAIQGLQVRTDRLESDLREQASAASDRREKIRQECLERIGHVERAYIRVVLALTLLASAVIGREDVSSVVRLLAGS